MIYSEDCNIEAPKLTDFNVPDKRAHLFIHYVKICEIFGHLSKLWRGQADITRHSTLQQQLVDWINDIPPELKLYDANGVLQSHDVNICQLYLMYFGGICLLYRSERLSSVSYAPTMASSCIARIFEELLERKYIPRLQAICSWFIMASLASQVPCLVDDGLAAIAKHEIGILEMACEECAVYWPTARTRMIRLRKILERSQVDLPLRQNADNVVSMNGSGSLFSLVDESALFPFPSDVCAKYKILTERHNSNNSLGTLASELWNENVWDDFGFE